MHMPAATVWPMSRMANLPNWGKSLAFSMTMGLVGWILTIAASPVFRNWWVLFLDLSGLRVHLLLELDEGAGDLSGVAVEHRGVSDR